MMEINQSLRITSIDYVNEMVDGKEKTFLLLKSGDTLISKIPEEEYAKAIQKFL